MTTIEEIKTNLNSLNARQIYRDKASGIIDQLTDFVESISTGSSSNIPSNSVVSETTWDITPTAGVLSNYSRGDHTHGTPTSPQGGGTPSDTVFGETTFGINSNAGSGTPYSRGDHTHGTPTNPVNTHESTYNHPTFITQTAITTHAGSTVSVHNFDSSGNAPSQTHDNTKHSVNYVPTTTTVNTKALSTNIVLTPDDLDDTSTTHKFATGVNTGDNSANSSTMYIGTTAHALNRASAAETLAGITLTTPVIGAATGTSLAATGALTSSGTAGIGYTTGAGGTITQATSKSTGVTLNKTCGTVIMNGAALAAATIVTFTVTNSTVAATDVIHVQHDSVGTTGGYTIMPNTPAAGSFKISVRNNTAGSLSEAIVLRFAVIKAVIA